MAISSKDIETLWGRYQSEGNDKTVAQGLALKNSVTVSHVNISQKPQYLLGLWCIVIGIGCLL